MKALQIKFNLETFDEQLFLNPILKLFKTLSSLPEKCREIFV